MCVLPQAEVLAHAVLLKDRAHISDIDRGGAGLGYQPVGDAGRVVVGVSVGDVYSDLLLTATRVVSIGFNLQMVLNHLFSLGK